MKLRTILAAGIFALLAQPGISQVPQTLNHQGRVAVQGTNFTGTGQFKFSLVSPFNQNQTATAVNMSPPGGITLLLVSNPGLGYVTPPTVTITDVTGTGATAEATIVDGSVTAITVTNQGSNYSASTTVTLSAPPENIQYFTTWANDGTAPINGAEPTGAVSVPVVNGLYSVQLGDTAAGMSEILPGVFHGLRYLRVWFNDGVNGFQQLTPDQPLAAAPYAFRSIQAEIADTVPDEAITYSKLREGAVVGNRIGNAAIMPQHLNNGAVTAAKLADGAVDSTKIASGAVTLAQLADGAVGPAKLAAGAINPLALDTGVGAPNPGQILSFTNDGLRWVNSAAGLALPYNSGAVSGATGQAMLHIQDTTPINGIAVRGDSTNGAGIFGTSVNGNGVVGSSSFAGGAGVSGTGSNGAGASGIRGHAPNGVGVYGTSGAGNGVSGYSASNDGVVGETSDPTKSGVYGHSGVGNGMTGFTAREGAFGGAFYHGHANGIALKVFGKSHFDGQIVNDWLEIKGNNGQRAYIGADSNNDIEVGSLNAALTLIAFYNRGSNQFMDIRARNATVNTLTINGADLAEPFITKNDQEHPAGSVMVISDERPGELQLGSEPYDKRVAGVISGAQGINTAIRLSQEGVNDSGQPVALTGRVYCRADASNGAIKPGDLLTTSANPGHAMKASDHSRTQGAVLGKAMSALDEGTGFVLVLVTLQ